MKCQKCGAEMVSGHLYCDICGSEYQIVPDFEPEIEYNIAKGMSEISESFEVENTKEETEETIEPVTMRKYKTPPFSLILFLVVICSVFVFFMYSQYTHSANYQSKRAVAAMESYDYYKAAQIYEDIRKNNEQDAVWYIKEAEIRLLMEQHSQAKELAVLALQTGENAEQAYKFLMLLLEKDKNYIEMYEYLKLCPFETVKDEYRQYLCVIPEINYESGAYDTHLEVSFEKGFQGNIYYTLDGSLPNLQSAKYEKAIKIGNGHHTLTAVYENAFGVIGEPVVWEYDIASKTPMAPAVSIDSGKYRYAEMIEVLVEEGTRVYYTTDLTHPTTESKEYTEPIPMPLGESRFNFIAVSGEGVESEVTQRNFMLNIKTNVSVEEAQNMLVQKLISTGHILDQNGAVKDRYGVFGYFYKFPISEEEVNYYVFEEHYLENQINNPLGHFYAIDVLYGKIYKVLKNDLGNFVRVELY